MQNIMEKFLGVLGLEFIRKHVQQQKSKIILCRELHKKIVEYPSDHTDEERGEVSQRPIMTALKQKR